MLREAARRPKRGMSQSLLDLVARRRSVDGLSSLADWLEGKGSGREADKVHDLAADVATVRRAARLAGATTASVLAVVRTRIGDGGLDSSAAALDRWSHGAIAAHADDLAALSELAHLEPDPAAFGGWLAEHLGAPGEDTGVTLASIHAVKGREWQHVVVHHATSGLLPHRLAWDLEEERRVFHVGLTRGVESVTVVTGDPPSQFVAEMEGHEAPAPRPAVASAATRGNPPRDPRSGGARVSAGSSRSPAVDETVPASVGFVFMRRGQEHEIVEVGRDGVLAVVRGSSAQATVRFGSTVHVAGSPVVLGHPACAQAAQRLRSWRSEKARSTSKPAYTIFDDRTLRALAAALPTSESGLAAIPGIGPVKLEAYGPALTSMFEELVSQPRSSEPVGSTGRLES
jgi:DNA helicase-2/ATP-dependent DNA helicase PcrA